MTSTHRIAGIVALAVLLVSAPAGASWSATPVAGGTGWDGDQQQTEKFSKTVPLPKGGSLDLANISGNIVITGGPGDQVVIEAVKRGRTAEDLKAVSVEVTTTATRVEVRAQYPRERRNVNASVDFAVTVPRAAGVVAHSVSGDITLVTIDGSAAIESVSGDVKVSGAGEISLGSVSGDVALKDVKARSLDANSVSGDLDLAGVTCSRARAKSVSGDIVFGGPLAKGGRYVFQSHSGDITVYADESAGFEVNANTFSGDISSDLPLVSTFGGEGERDRGQRGRGPGGGPGQRVRGTFGDGGAFLELSTFSGDVRIAKKTAAKAVKK
jgi:DUF4097 and DUF4098 domain-containing protein YvlB